MTEPAEKPHFTKTIINIMWITSKLEPSQWLTAFVNNSFANEDIIVEHFIGTWLCEPELLYFVYQNWTACTYVCTYVHTFVHMYTSVHYSDPHL